MAFFHMQADRVGQEAAPSRLSMMAERCDVGLLYMALLLLICVCRVAGPGGGRLRSPGPAPRPFGGRRAGGSTAGGAEASAKPDKKNRETQRQNQADDHASEKAALEFFHLLQLPAAAPRAGGRHPRRSCLKGSMTFHRDNNFSFMRRIRGGAPAAAE